MLIKRVAGAAALAIADFVRALAGTDESERMPLALPAGEGATESVPRPPSPPRGKRPSEERVFRPRRNAVLTHAARLAG